MEELKSQLQEQHKNAIAALMQEYNHIVEKYKHMKQQEY